LNRDTEAKLAITEVIYRYCRALDRMDRALADTVWHPDGTADYGPTFEGPASKLLDVMWVNHAALAGHSHQVTNILIDVDGDTAGSEAYVTGFLWSVSDEGAVSHMLAIGRYLDRWSLRNGAWAIDHRRFVFDAVFPSDSSDRSVFGRLAKQRDPRRSAARRDQTDPSYEVVGRLTPGLMV
jgi:SnoaL-like domain